MDKASRMNPSRLPIAGNKLTRGIGRMMLSGLGWRIDGNLPSCAKCIAVVAPHSSNWDFVITMAALLKMGLKVGWMGKAGMFRWPLRRLFLKLGGIPIERTNASGVVGRFIDEFKNRSQLVLALAPEGTRDRVKRWKTGFYHIAVGAGVPMIFVGMDYSRKAIDLSSLYVPSGDLPNDLADIQQHFTRFQPRNPA